jgi:hypothetical protein
MVKRDGQQIADYRRGLTKRTNDVMARKMIVTIDL